MVGLPGGGPSEKDAGRGETERQWEAAVKIRRFPFVIYAATY